MSAAGRHARPRFLAVGEGGVAVELGAEIDEEVNARIHLLAGAVSRELGHEVEEIVPTYRSLLVLFDPLRVPRARLVARLAALLDELPAVARAARGRVLRVPVGYGGELGPDLEEVAEHAGLAPDEVVAIHGSVAYRVFMLGFTPGFPYLGGMPPRIAVPRREVPRQRIPAGSVGIAGSQTGIYPIESPGGWRIIGRTPLRLFDPASTEPFLFAAGDRVRFVAVDEARWRAIDADVRAGRWRVELEPPAPGERP